MSLFQPRTLILALTREAELHRLLRSILEPGCKVIAGDPPVDDVATGEPADIVVLDLEPFDLEMASRVRRAYPGAEILAICGTYREADCIAILERNVDCLPRPFAAQDLIARVRVAELRRLRTTGRGRFYRCGPVVIDLVVPGIDVDGKPVALARSELNILMRLAGRPGQVATFGEILAGLGRADTERGRRGLNMAIFRLRRRIERNPSRPQLVLTEAGVGYRLAPESDLAWPPDAAEPVRRGLGSFQL
jgi:two-component system KDP operon response regulator KdpE